MASNSVKVQFEIGHESIIRNKKTVHGFTHDWELFVRGAENTDIHYFVEKVIFHLHESFQSPRRVVKEAPYCVRESGYAGFSLPIDIYLKNKDEPHKIRFNYHLTLQEQGPPLTNVVKEKYIFNNPSEDFRRKLIRGGGVGIGADNIRNASEDRKGSSSKVKSSQDTKKSKVKEVPPVVEEPDLNDPFSIFGQPIKTSKLPTVTKSSGKNSQGNNQKIGKLPSKEKEKDREKEKQREKEKEKEREKEKEKLKNEKLLAKKTKEEKKIKDKSGTKNKSSKISKGEGKRENVEEKIKEKIPEKLDVKVDRKDEKKHEEKKVKSKDKSKEDKREVKEPTVEKLTKVIKEKDDKKSIKEDKEEKDEEVDKLEVKKSSINTLDKKDQDKREKREKHKQKKEKNKDDKKKEEKKTKTKEIKQKDKSASPLETLKILSPKKSKTPLNALFDELSDKSDSDASCTEHDVKVPKETKVEVDEFKISDMKVATPDMKQDIIEESTKKSKKKTDENGKKRKKKNKDKESKKSKVSYDQLKVKTDPLEMNGFENKDEITMPRTPATPQYIPRFTDDYIHALKELQKKIMTLDDRTGINNVVEVIADTGLYEITNKTFDFDLCLLDTITIKRLQDIIISLSL